jgi:aquaporin Z
MKRFAAELCGTFALVFAGTGAIVVNDVSGGVVTHVGISLTFGLIVLAMIYTFGEVSGAHLNPAVTLGFWVAGRFETRSVTPYILSQCLGALLASVLLLLMFPHHPTLGATRPTGSALQAFVFEAVLSWLLMLVILSVSTNGKEKGILAGLTVGSVIAVEALFAGPVSGASMNPARSLAPAVLSRDLESLWIYLTAPFIGAFLAIPAYKCTQKGCRIFGGGASALTTDKHDND